MTDVEHVRATAPATEHPTAQVVALSLTSDPQAGWLVCEGVAGFASLQEGVRRARAAMARGDHSAIRPVPEPVGAFINDWMAERRTARQQTVFVLDDASRIWASRLITYLSQMTESTSQRLHFIHRNISGATVSLAHVCVAGGAQADCQIYWADARGRGSTSHEVRDAFSSNGDVLTVLVGPMSAGSFDKVCSMLRAQWELRRGSLRRVVLLVTSECSPPVRAINALLEDFGGAARAAYVNLSDAGQCWNAMLAAVQDLSASDTPRDAAPSTLSVATMTAPQVPAQRTETPTPEVLGTKASAQSGIADTPPLILLGKYAQSDGLRSVALFNHLGELIAQRDGASWSNERQAVLFGSPEPIVAPPPESLPMQGTAPMDDLRRSRQGEALRALLAAAGLQPPKHLLIEGRDTIDVLESVHGMPTLWVWSSFSARHVAPVHALVMSGRVTADLGVLMSKLDDPWEPLMDRQRVEPGAQEAIT